MTVEEQVEDAYAPLIAYEKEQSEIKSKCLDYVKTQVSDDLYDDILDYIESCDDTSIFEITSEEPKTKHRQSEDYDHLKEVWVDQYCNGGYTGDSFAGWIHIKINNKEYLKFHYSMC